MCSALTSLQCSKHSSKCFVAISSFYWPQTGTSQLCLLFLPPYSLELRLKWDLVKDGASEAALCFAVCQDDGWSIAGMRWALWKVSGAQKTTTSSYFLLSVFCMCLQFSVLERLRWKKNCIILDTESIFINSAVDNFIPIYNAFWLLSTVSSPSSLPPCHAHPLPQRSLS